MKNNILVCISLLMIITLLSSCKNAKNDVIEYTDITNASGLIEKKIYSSEDGSSNSNIEYKYDENSNIISEVKTKDDGTFEYKMEYEYKKYGNTYKESKKTYYFSEDKIEYYFSKYEYEKYGEDENADYLVKSCVQYDCDGKFMSKFEYKYDDNGNLKSMVTLDKDGNILTENNY